jgi:hypothetical protein
MTSKTNIISRWNLPPERDFSWKMKTMESAKTSFITDNDGVIELSIEHDIIQGVTPKMLMWWFCNIGGEMTYKGKTYPKYLVWHPRDHIHWSLAEISAKRQAGVGSYFRIVEAFGRNIKFLIDSTELVEKLDETGIKLVKRIGAIEIFSLQHDFMQDGHNTRYKSKMTVGSSKKPFNKIFNSCIRPLFFTNDMANAWLKHNIEEVGNFELFSPELYYQEVAKTK